MNPKVSVIVPIYNVEQYLDRCVESILAQTFTDFELILVDDGSPDNCPQMCDDWAKKDERIRVIHKKNEGVSIARNTALDVIKGEYVAFCDSDDEWDIDLLNKVVHIFHKEQVDNVLFNMALYRDGVKKDITHFKPGLYALETEEKKIDYIIKILLPRHHGWEMCARVFKSEIIQKNNIRCCTSCNNFAEDMGFVLKYTLNSNRMYCIEQGLYKYYTNNPNSMMRKSAEIVRINEMNEVSNYVSKEFDIKIKTPKERKKYPIIHFLIVNNQMRKIYYNNQYEQISMYINEISNIHWWRKNIKGLCKSYRLLKNYFGKENAQRTIMFSNYLRHGNWKRYCYESAIYYKFFRKLTCRR